MTTRYDETYRRVLLDMHITDSDPRFLARIDPARIAATYRQAGITGAMFYAQSHVGLCYWPTVSGKRHASIGGRDLVHEWLDAFAANGLASCAYYSVTYNNWAAETHPEWRVDSPPRTDGTFPGPRFGVVCPNNPEYRAFLRNQIAELVGGYPLESIFFDMTYLFPRCMCAHCQHRLRSETGLEIPETINWLSAEWTRFQQCRGAWAEEYGEFITANAHSARPGISVHHNFGAPRDWVFVSPFSAAGANAYLAGDFSGDPDEQLVVTKLYDRLSIGHPVEYMTSFTRNVTDHVTLKSARSIEGSALAAIGSSAAFLVIDAVDPSGDINDDAYQIIADINSRIATLEPSLGGEPVEDVAIYFSDASRMDFLEEGEWPESAVGATTNYPHYHAVRGAAQALQRAHIPFGIVTKKQLTELLTFRLVILPNVLRMDEEEIAAVRSYVNGGGAVYASRYSSLFDTVGGRRSDFGLSELFGCHFGADDLAGSALRSKLFVSSSRPRFDGTDYVYLEPTAGFAKAAIAPQRFVAHWPSPNARAGAVRLDPKVEGEVLADLALPYDDQWGSTSQPMWASIHSAPPWRLNVAPALVFNAFGKGRVVYCALDLETIEAPANRSLFLALVHRLIGSDLSAALAAPHSVWLTVRKQSDRGRLIVSIVDRSDSREASPLTNLQLDLDPPEGKRFVRVVELPNGHELAFEVLADGKVRTTVPRLERIEMIAAYYN